MLELPRLSNTEKTFLQNHLEYNKEILGVKGSNSAIVNTVNATPGNNNHIINGQKYWRNGIEYNGILQELTSTDIIQNDLINPITNTITSPVISGNSAIIIPANTYTHSNINFDITNLKISVSSFDESEASIDEMVERIDQDINNNNMSIENKIKNSYYYR